MSPRLVVNNALNTTKNMLTNKGEAVTSLYTQAI
jgi:hypothetical protein